jgi:predicted anti-sigma-YlaC factor YlaD
VLSCSDCLARHSEYLDGVMDTITADVWRTHLAECADCARYDRVVRRGLMVLAAQPHIEPTPDFMTQLQQRLSIEDRRTAMRPMTSLAGASVAVAAMLAFAAWIPVLILVNDSQPVPAQVSQAAPVSETASEIAWHAERAVERREPGHIHMASRRVAWAPTSTGQMITPDYSPVLLESPIAPPNYSRPYYGE